MAVGGADFTLLEFEALFVRLLDDPANFLLGNVWKTFLRHVNEVVPGDEPPPVKRERILPRLVAQEKT
jgi:hypothetical protein